jgi:hypothetical protein
LELYDFADTLSRLDDLDDWLKSLGHCAPDRIRQYRQNIRNVTAAENRGEIEELKSKITYDKAREVLWSYVEADEFVRAITALRACFGNNLPAAPIERALQGPVDLFLENENNSEGRNFMFELIIGGRLARAGFPPSFDKGPDLHFEFAGLQVAVQCKRPLSASGLQKNIGKAIAQLQRDDPDLGLIAISVSRLLNPGDPNRIPEVLDAEIGQVYLKDRLRQIADETHRFWSGKIKRTSILFYAFTPIRSQRENGYHMTRNEVMCPVATDEPAATILKCLAQALHK